MRGKGEGEGGERGRERGGREALLCSPCFLLLQQAACDWSGLCATVMRRIDWDEGTKDWEM